MSAPPVRWAVSDRNYEAASAIAHPFRAYLARSGLLRRPRCLGDVAGEVGVGGFSKAAVLTLSDNAWTLFTRGQSAEAIRQLKEHPAASPHHD